MDGVRKEFKKIEPGTYRFVEQFGDKEESSRNPIAPWAEQPGGALIQRAVEPGLQPLEADTPNFPEKEGLASCQWKEQTKKDGKR